MAEKKSEIDFLSELEKIKEKRKAALRTSEAAAPKRGERVKSGIDGLDEALGGGFVKNSVIVIAGPNGSGKTVSSMQFIINGMLKYDELGLFISIDEEKRPMCENMRSLGWDLEKLEKEKKMVFIDYPHHEVEQFYTQENTILNLIKSMGVKRVVVDSAVPLALVYEKEDERRVGMIDLVSKIRRWNCTTLITCEDKGKAEISQGMPSTKYEIESVADGYIYLYNLYREGERKRALEILKMRGSAHSNKLIPMEIGEGGMRIFPKKRFDYRDA
ncbi:hypothetical protein AUJ17_01535 [Candidatus Micrarchaeota archaeon CG1_02_47_40]|nr:MAG: hypothetical protein AUJ17_01535 [Candidatus Micrarchaeota archaeon CG1_02_47_40]